MRPVAKSVTHKVVLKRVVKLAGTSGPRRLWTLVLLRSRVRSVMEEESLYDVHGRPKAYIADDGGTIYMWDGNAVAYLMDDKVYGWNGRHLGWLVDGVVYDLHGRRVAYLRSTCPVATETEPAKHAKSAKHAKYARYALSARPALTNQRSALSLDDLLREGSV